MEYKFDQRKEENSLKWNYAQARVFLSIGNYKNTLCSFDSVFTSAFLLKKNGKMSDEEFKIKKREIEKEKLQVYREMLEEAHSDEYREEILKGIRAITGENKRYLPIQHGSYETNEQSSFDFNKKHKTDLDSLLELDDSDFLQLGDFKISIRTFGKGLNWYEQNNLAFKNSLFMMNLKQGMIFYNAIMKSKNKRIHLLKADRNPLEDNVRDELYRQLTEDCSFNLNAFFENNKGIWTMKQAIGPGSCEEDWSYIERKIEIPINELRYVNLTDFTNEGLPITKHSNQRFLKGKNILFIPLRDESVARFQANNTFPPTRENASLNCGASPFSACDYLLGTKLVDRLV